MPSCASDISIAHRLLQPAQVRNLLQAALRRHLPEVGSIREVRIERCWPGRHGSMRLEWSFEWSSGSRFHLFGFWSPEKEMKCIDAEPRAIACRPPALMNIREVVPRWNTLVFSPDQDDAMRHLPACLDGVQLARLISACREMPGSANHAKARWHASLLAFKPGRRATMSIKASSEGGKKRMNFAGKTFADERGKALLERHRLIGEQMKEMKSPVEVPAPVGFIEPLKLAVFDWVSSRSTPHLSPAAYAQVLAAVHRLHLPELPVFTIDSEVAIVQQWQAVLLRLRPAQAAFAQPIVDAIVDAAAVVDPGCTCVIHRDFYDRQVLSDGQSLAICDLDTLAQGPAAVDLGNLAAHETLGALMAGRPLRVDAQLRSLMQAYGAVASPLHRRTVAFFFATSLLRVGAVHCLRSATRRFSRPLWRRAATLLRSLGAVGGAQ